MLWLLWCVLTGTREHRACSRRCSRRTSRWTAARRSPRRWTGRAGRRWRCWTRSATRWSRSRTQPSASALGWSPAICSWEKAKRRNLNKSRQVVPLITFATRFAQSDFILHQNLVSSSPLVVSAPAAVWLTWASGQWVFPWTETRVRISREDLGFVVQAIGPGLLAWLVSVYEVD